MCVLVWGSFILWFLLNIWSMSLTWDPFSSSMPIIWKFDFLLVSYIFFCMFLSYVFKIIFLAYFIKILYFKSWYSTFCLWRVPLRVQVGLLGFSILFYFNLSPLQYFSLIIESRSQVLDWLLHFHQSHVCASLCITWCLFLIRSFPLILLSYFCAFFKLLKFFHEAYNCSFKFCILEFISLHFYRTARFGEEKRLALAFFFILFVVL